MPANDNQDEPREEFRLPDKSADKWRNMFAWGIGILIAVMLIYFWIRAKHPEWIQNIINASNWLVLIALIVAVLYIIFSKIRVPVSMKEPVPVDRAIELAVENMCRRYNIPCRYDTEKKVFVPMQKDRIQVKENNRHPHFHRETGDNWLLIEMEVRDGLHQGIHMLDIPIDKGEKIIKEGYYRLDDSTCKSMFNLQKINFPMSSLADKNDRMRMLALDAIGEGKEIPDNIKPMFEPNQQSMIGTPLDNYDGVQMQQPYYRYTPRRRYNNYRRR